MSARRSGSIRDISPKKNGTKWLIRISLGGDDPTGNRPRLNRVLNGAKSEAQKWLTAHLRRKDEGMTVALSRQVLGAWLDEWNKDFSGDASARTRDDYAKLSKRYITPELRQTRLSELTPKAIQRLVNSLTTRGLSPRTVRMAHGMLRTALNKALHLRMIAYNPATFGVTLPKMRKQEMRAMNPSQATAFLDKAKADPWYALFGVLLMGGLRPSEALALKRDDLDGSTLRVQRALVKAEGGGRKDAPTKTGNGRAVPLPAFVVTAIREHLKIQAAVRLRRGPRYKDQGYIFATKSGSPLEMQNLINRHYKPILAAAKLPHFRLYDLRHSCATLLFADGVPPKVVQERLGHSSIMLTLGTYTHVLPGMQEDAAARLEKRFG